MSSSARSAPEQPEDRANEVAEGLGKSVTSETDTAVSLKINESSLASPSQAHPNPCTHTEDLCIDGTHYCEQMPCVMTDEHWPCAYA